MPVFLKADRLRQHIHESNKTQSQFAREAGIRPSCVSMLLKGKTRPSPYVRRQILKAIRADGHEISFDELFQIVDEKPQPEKGAHSKHIGASRAPTPE
jgi:transcriptional regulator with XRE-family HTH domain